MKKEIDSPRVRVTYANDEQVLLDSQSGSVDAQITKLQVLSEKQGINSWAERIEFLNENGDVLSTYTREKGQDWMKQRVIQ